MNKLKEDEKEAFEEVKDELKGKVDEMELGNIQLNPNTAAEKWLPKDKQYVYETYRGERRITPCHWPWSGIVINWDGGVTPCSIVDDHNSDFGNVFFKKNQYNYGILISNYPSNDSRNTMGVSGVKIITSGEREWRNQVTLVQNDSMYNVA